MFEFAVRAAARLSPSAREAIAAVLATLDQAFSADRRDGLRRNLDAVAAWGHPALDTDAKRRAAARAIFRAYHRGVLDYLASRDERANAGAGAAAPLPRFTGAERLYHALASGRGAVITIPHLGNWERAGLIMARLGFRIHVVTGVQFHAALSGAARAAKESDRIAVSTPSDGYLPLLRTLRRGGIVILLADGDVYTRGETRRFFGAPVEFPVGPALLARRAGVSIVHAYTAREAGGGERIVFESVDHPNRSRPLAEDLSRLTEGVVRALERAV
ncbi:MAG TPA: lysophospholipid acyltransferase family protein, partial [Candidatus Eisenbacteria bacterium]|nr:lysophospholipid acyltransferase family protein [Candidatus Eisenbacteria bacterium]